MSATIYLDNAATTSLDPSVLEEMLPFMTTYFGNPSSTYSIGRTVRSAVEAARKKVADLLNVSATTVYFTSGGTESNNTAISCAIHDLGCTHIITSAIEHHAVLYTVEKHCKKLNLSYSFVELLPNGEIDYTNLEEQLVQSQKDGKKCLVSLMHANNEIGTLLDLNLTGELCQQYDAIFHSDCVQTVGHYPMDLSATKVHFVSAAGHKFHGPKGVGILYINKEIKVNPLIYGGGQERNMRAGTENIYGIVGFAKALENAMTNFTDDHHFIGSLKTYFKKMLIDTVPGVSFNSPENSLYTVLSVCFSNIAQKEMMLIHFDMAGLCVSSGSACSSGDAGSHVINKLNTPKDSATIRFSFSKHNTFAEIDDTINIITSVLAKVRPLTATLNSHS
jgi:cysteine desulfurase